MKGKSIEQKEQQLLRKLNPVKDVVELKKIYSSVQEQNNTLRSDILALKYKVDVLMQKQKGPTHRTAEDQIKEKEIEDIRKELKYQYRLMQELKRRQQVGKAQQPTQELTEQAARIANQSRLIDGEIETERRQAQDLKNETTRLERTLQGQEEEMSRNQPKIKQIEQENRQLRKKILALQKVSTQKEYQSAKVMNSMYTIKSKYTKNEELCQQIERKPSLRDSKPSGKQTKPYSSQLMSVLKEKKVPSKQELLNLPELEKEVDELRKAMRQKEKEDILNGLSGIRRKEQLLQSNKELVRQSKQLQDKRSRVVNELNKYKKAWQKHLELQNSNKHLKQYSQNSAQAVQFSQSLQLRRDFAGILGGKHQFDDRLVLRKNSKSYIIGLLVYQLDHTSSAKNLLVAIRAIYDDQEANAANEVPIPGQYLAKCRLSKYTLVEGDFVKLLKVKYNSQQNRILKLQVRTNRNNRYEFGDKRSFSDILQGQNVYGFDISVQEYPVSLFGSYNCARSQWFLQSLGAQINQLSP